MLCVAFKKPLGSMKMVNNIRRYGFYGVSSHLRNYDSATVEKVLIKENI